MSTSLVRKTVNEFLKLYFLPARKNGKLKRYVKDVVLMDEEEHLTKPVRFLQQEGLLSGRPVVLDIGCAFGSATEAFLRVMPSCQVFAFEPNPQLAGALEKKFKHQQVKVFNKALSNEPGVVTFNLADNAVSSSYKTVEVNEQFMVRNSFEVEAECLDQLFVENSDIDAIDIIKLDVQGAELDVLSGGVQVLKKTKLLIVEQSIRSPYSGGSKYYEVDEFLRRHGFEILDIITTYRKRGMILNEFDAIYINRNLNLKLT